MLDGRYELGEVLGAGGQGVLYRAWDTRLRRAVALKFRAIPLGIDPDALLDEARTLMQVPPHPNVVVVRSDFFHEDQHVLVMDFVEGPSLADRLRATDRGLPAAEVVAWLRPIAAALDHLHALVPAVAHGDVKPGNIVGGGDAPVLVDFGLAVFEGAVPRSAATAAYAPPERGTHGATPAGDVYSLAATAFAALTGGPPTPGTDAALAPAARAELARGLATDPTRRPATAAALVDSLADALGVAAPKAAPLAVRRAPRRRFALVAVALVVLAGVLVAAMRPESRERPSAVAVAVTTTAPASGGAASAAVTTSTSAPSAVAPSTTARAVTTEAPIARVALVNAAGIVDVQRLYGNGTMVSQRASTTDHPWSAAARISDGALFLYRSDGANTTATVASDGALDTGRSLPVTGAGWTHVVGLAEGVVFFYNRADGFMRAIRFGTGQRVLDEDSYPERRLDSAGYDHVVSAGGTRVLFYAQRGAATLGELARDGTLTLRAVQLPAGLLGLAPTGNGYVLGLTEGGDAHVLRATSAGVTAVRRVPLPRGTWRAGVGLAAGTLLHDAANGGGLLVSVDEAGEVTAAPPVRTPAGSLVVAVD